MKNINIGSLITQITQILGVMPLGFYALIKRLKPKFRLPTTDYRFQLTMLRLRLGLRFKSTIYNLQSKICNCYLSFIIGKIYQLFNFKTSQRPTSSLLSLLHASKGLLTPGLLTTTACKQWLAYSYIKARLKPRTTFRFVSICLLFTAYCLLPIVAEGAAKYGKLIMGTTAGGATPQYKRYNVSADRWDASVGTITTAGNIRWIVTETAPTTSTRTETIVGILNDNDNLYIQIYDCCSWVSSGTVGLGLSAYRGFDIAYEQNSGDAILVYVDGANLRYRVWNGTSWNPDWSVAGTLIGEDLAGTNRWVELTSLPNSDEIALAVSDSNFDLDALVWDGNNWSCDAGIAGECGGACIDDNTSQLGFRQFDLEYENSGELLVFYGVAADADLWYATKTAGSCSWTRVEYATTNEVPDFVEAASQPGTDQIVVTLFDDAGNDCEMVIWNGGGFNARVSDATCNAFAAPQQPIGGEWVGTSGRAIVVYADNVDADLDSYWWEPNAWTALDYNDTPDTANEAQVLMKRYPSENRVLALIGNNNSDLFGRIYTTGGWGVSSGGVDLTEGTLSTITYKPFGFAFDGEWPTININASGTQTLTVIPGSTNNVIGAFRMSTPSGSLLLKRIRISESGTIDANTELSNIRVYYDTNGIWEGTGAETQYGTSTAFSGVNGYAIFNQNLLIGATTIYFYVVADVAAGATRGDTIDLEITTADLDGTCPIGYVATATVPLPGTTTINRLPVVNIDTVSQVSTDGTGKVVLQFDLSDADLHTSRLLVEYSTNAVNFYQTYISASSVGSVDNTGVPAGTSTGQIRLISVPVSNATFTWDTQSVNNQLGALFIEDSSVYLRVTANDSYEWGSASTSAGFTVDNLAPTGVTCNTPSNGATRVSVNPTLVANAGSDLSTINYYFQIDKDTGYAPPDLQESGWQAGTSWVPPTTLASGTVYYWHVRGRDSYGNTASYSSNFSFTTNYFPSVSFDSVTPIYDYSGKVEVQYDASDGDLDQVNLLVEYSTDSTNWNQAYIGTTSAGSVDNTGVPAGTSTGQIRLVPTPANNATFSWETLNANNQGGALPDDTTVWLRIRPNDNMNYGNYATSSSFMIDNNAPTTTDDWTDNWTGTSPVTVNLSPTDGTGSGVQWTRYCTDTVNLCDPVTAGITGTSVSVSCATGATCTTYIRYASRDNVNNTESVKSERVRQDLQAPVTTDDWTDNWTGTSPLTVTLTPSDADGSGVQWTKYCTDTVNLCDPVTAGITGTSVSVSCPSGATCTQYVRYASRDNVNNTEAVKSERVRQDRKAPDGIANSSPASGSVCLLTPPTLTSTAGSEAETPPISYYFQVDTISTFSSGNLQSSGWQASTSWVPPAELASGTKHYWRVKGKDSVGNETSYSSAWEFTTSYANAPCITINSAQQTSTDGTGMVTVNYDLVDPQNSVAELLIKYSFDGSTWYKAWIGSTSVGTVNNSGARQITGISTPVANATFTWDSKNSGNEGGAFLDEDTDVYIKVQTYDTTWGEEKQSSAFLLDNKAPTNYACSSPPNGAVGVSVNPTLLISAGADISTISYFIQLDEDTSFAPPALQESGWQDSLTWNPPTTLNQGTKYYWHVRAKDYYGNIESYNGGYSSPTWDFTTGTNEPDVNIDNASQISVDGTGIVRVQYDLQDPQNDTCSIRIEYSYTGASPWNLAYISNKSVGTISNPGNITGITTPQSNQWFEWDTRNAGNGGGAYSGESNTVYIRITPNDGSQDGQTRYFGYFTVDNQSPSGYANQYPASGETDVTVNPTLVAQAGTDISLIYYKFQIKYATGSWSLAESSWTGTSWAVPTTLSYSTNYDYRVIAKDQYGNVNYASSTWTFTTQAPPDTSAWPFTVASDYIYDSAKITVSSDMAQLRPNVSPEWCNVAECNDSWKRRRAITITATGYTLTNHQVRVSLDATFDYANAKANGEDIRFTDSSGTLLNHWTQNFASGSSATFWVKVPYIQDSATIYMYYNNPSATDISSLSNTMTLNTFTDGVTGWGNLNSSTNITKTYNMTSPATTGNDIVIDMVTAPLSPLVVDSETVILNCNTGCYYSYIMVKNGGKIKTTQNNALRLYAKSIYVDSLSSIDANGMGASGGAENGVYNVRNNGSGTQPGQGGRASGCGANLDGAGGGGGGNGGAGGQGGGARGSGAGNQGTGGGTIPDDNNLYFGSGGGAGGKSGDSSCGAGCPNNGRANGGRGGNGGGAILLDAEVIRIEGRVEANGENGSAGFCYNDDCSGGGGGGGSGGTIIIRGKSVTVTAGATLSANGGKGGSDSLNAGPGGGGGGGKIKIFCESTSANCNGQVVGSRTVNGGGAGYNQGTAYAPDPAAGSAGINYISPAGSFTYTYTSTLAGAGSFRSNAIAPFFIGETFKAQNTVPGGGSGASLNFTIRNASTNAVLCSITSAQANTGYDTSTCTQTDVAVYASATLSMTNAPGSPEIASWTYQYYTRNQPSIIVNTSVGEAEVFSYYTDKPTIQPILERGYVFGELLTFEETLGAGNEGSVRYQISNDGTNWYYHNGSAWVSASEFSQTNTAGEINANATSFDNYVGAGTLYFKAYLVSDGSQKVQLDSVDITYNLPIAPSVTSISPTSGVAGTEVTINGSNFGIAQGSSKVYFAGIDAGSANSWSNSQIVINAPADVASGYIRVQVNGVLSDEVPASYFSVLTPTITSITPSSGYWADVVTIAGNNFGNIKGSSYGKFYNNKTASCSSWTNTSITCTVPSGAESGLVRVVTSGGESNGVAFTVGTDQSIWPFEIAGDYTVSDSAKVNISNGYAYLKTTNSPPWATFGVSVFPLWGYRRAITINNSGAALPASYQIQINLNESNFNFSHAQNDGDDIRFTKSDGVTQIANYWIENYDSNLQTAKIWVKMPDPIPAGNSTIYIYYGNANASAASNKGNTLDSAQFTDPFNNWSLISASNSVQIISGNILSSYIINTTARTCNDTWGNPCSGCTNYITTPDRACVNGTPPTSDCSGTDCNGSEGIDGITINQGTYLSPGSQITITVNYHCYDAANRISIRYLAPGAGAWTNWNCFNCAGAGSYTGTYGPYTLNNTMGTHWIRVSNTWNTPTCPYSCASSYCDNDQVSIFSYYKTPSDITSNEIIGYMGPRAVGGISFQSPNTVESGASLSYKIINADTEQVLCTITSPNANAGVNLEGVGCATGTYPIKLYAEIVSTATRTAQLQSWTLNYYSRQTSGDGNLTITPNTSEQAPTYPSDSPWVRNNTGRDFEELISFTSISGPRTAGSIKYVISHNGSNWYYWNGTNWVLSSGVSQSNTAEEVDENVQQFSEDIGGGTFYFRAYLVSDGSQAVEIDGVSVNVSQVTIDQVQYDGTQAGDGDDFVELYNPFRTSYNLAGHVLGDGDDGGGAIDAGDFTITSGSIASQSLYIFTASQTAFISRFGCEASKVNQWGAGTINLNNTGDEIFLKQSAGATSSIDLVVWGVFQASDLPEGATATPFTPAPTTLEGQSLNRMLQGYEGNEKDTGADPDVSPENQEQLASNFVIATSTPYCVPPTSGTILIADNDGFTRYATPTIAISCEDPAGTACNNADWMRLACTEGALSGASWIPYETKCNETGYSCTFNILTGAGCTSGEGLKTVWIEFKDEKGNIQTTHNKDSTYYDITAPTILEIRITSDKETYLCGTSDSCIPTISTTTTPITGTAYFNNLGGEGAGQKMQIEVVWSDAPVSTGVYKFEGSYAFSETPTYDGTTPGADINGADGWSQYYKIDAGEGDETNILFTVHDRAGNTKTFTLNLLQDNTDPTITYNAYPGAGKTIGWFGTAPPGNIIDIDFGWVARCPLDYAQYSTGSAWIDIFTTNQSSNYTANWGWDTDANWNNIGQCNNYVSIKVADACGNVRTDNFVQDSTGFIVRKDTLPPQINTIEVYSSNEGRFYGTNDYGATTCDPSLYPSPSCTAWFNSLAGEGAGQIVYVRIGWTDACPGAYDRLQGYSAFGGELPVDHEGPPWEVSYTVDAGEDHELGKEFKVFDKAGNYDTVKIDFRYDNADPSNPTTFTGWDSSGKNEELTSGEWYFYPNPYFEWTSGVDNPIGDAVGVDWYYMAFSTDPAFIPNYATNVTYYSTGSLVCGATYSLRLYTEDRVDNATSTITGFVYGYDNGAPSITDNQSGDDTWRNANTGIYDVVLDDSCGSKVIKFWTKVCKTAADCACPGADCVENWTLVGETIPTPYTNWSLLGSTFNSMIEGTNYVSVRVEDLAHFFTTATYVFHVKKDTIPPTVTVNSPSSGTWKNATFTIDISDGDQVGLSGVATCSYRVESYNGASWDLTKDWTFRTCNSPTSATITVGIGQDCRNEGSGEGSGACRVLLRTTDNATNLASTTIYYKIDWTPPTVAYDEPPTPASGSWASATFSIQYDATDALSGTLDCKLYTSTDEGSSWTDRGSVSCGSNQSANITVGSGQWCDVEGSNKCAIRVKSWDYASNTAQIDRHFNTDWTAPTIVYNSPAAGSDTWHDTDPGAIIDIDFICTGAGVCGTDSSSLDYAQFRINALDWENIFTDDRNTDYTDNWAVNWANLSFGGNEISIKVADIAGNTASHSYIALTSGFRFWKDNTGPTFTSISVTSDNEPYFYGTGDGVSCNPASSPACTIYFQSISEQGAPSTITVSITWDDNLSAEGSMERMTGSAAFGEPLQTTYSTPTSTIQYTVEALAGDQNGVIFTIYDRAGNYATTSINFVEDNNAPTPIAIASINEDNGVEYLYASGTTHIYYSNQGASEFTVKATAIDSGAGLRNATGSTMFSDTPADYDYTDFEYDIGPYTLGGAETDSGTLAVYIYDRVANVGSNTIIVVRDVTSPTMTPTGWSESPASDYLYISGNKMWFSDEMPSTATGTLSGTASDGSGSGLWKVVFTEEPSINVTTQTYIITGSSWSGDFGFDSGDSDTSSPTNITIYDNVSNYYSTNTYTYASDTIAPNNPSPLPVDGYEDNCGVPSEKIDDSKCYTYPSPCFSWSAVTDNPAINAGLRGYYVSFTQNATDDPSNFQTATTYDVASGTLTDGTWYLRIKTVDNVGNKSAPVTAFTYIYGAEEPAYYSITIDTPVDSRIAGSPIEMTILAKRADGTNATCYNADIPGRDYTWSGAGNAPAGTAPLFPNDSVVISAFEQVPNRPYEAVLNVGNAPTGERPLLYRAATTTLVFTDNNGISGNVTFEIKPATTASLTVTGGQMTRGGAKITGWCSGGGCVPPCTGSYCSTSPSLPDKPATVLYVLGSTATYLVNIDNNTAPSVGQWSYDSTNSRIMIADNPTGATVAVDAAIASISAYDSWWNFCKYEPGTTPVTVTLTSGGSTDKQIVAGTLSGFATSSLTVASGGVKDGRRNVIVVDPDNGYQIPPEGSTITVKVSGIGSDVYTEIGVGWKTKVEIGMSGLSCDTVMSSFYDCSTCSWRYQWTAPSLSAKPTAIFLNGVFYAEDTDNATGTQEWKWATSTVWLVNNPAGATVQACGIPVHEPIPQAGTSSSTVITPSWSFEGNKIIMTASEENPCGDTLGTGAASGTQPMSSWNLYTVEYSGGLWTSCARLTNDNAYCGGCGEPVGQGFSTSFTPDDSKVVFTVQDENGLMQLAYVSANTTNGLGEDADKTYCELFDETDCNLDMDNCGGCCDSLYNPCSYDSDSSHIISYNESGLLLAFGDPDWSDSACSGVDNLCPAPGGGTMSCADRLIASMTPEDDGWNLYKLGIFGPTKNAQNIYTYQDSGVAELIDLSADGYWVMRPKWSPDCKKIAFVVWENPGELGAVSKTSIYYIDLTAVGGFPITSLSDAGVYRIYKYGTDGTFPAYFPAWSADSTLVSYSVDKSNTMKLWNLISHPDITGTFFSGVNFDTYLEYIGDQATYATPTPQLVTGGDYNEFGMEQCFGDSCPDTTNRPWTYIAQKTFTNNGELKTLQLSNESTISENGGLLFYNGVLTAVFPANVVKKEMVISVDVPTEFSPGVPSNDANDDELAILVSTGIAREFYPDGAQFDAQIRLIFHYTSEQIGGIDGTEEENQLHVYYWDDENNRWIAIDGIVDTANNTITVWSDHFSRYDVFLARLGYAPDIFAPIQLTNIHTYPNPWLGAGEIVFNADKYTGSYNQFEVSVKIYDLRGKEVVSLYGLADPMQPGVVCSANAPSCIDLIRWNGRNSAGRQVASGIYFYYLTARDTVNRSVVTKKGKIGIVR